MRVRRAYPVRKSADGALRGFSSTRPDEKPQCSRSIRPRKSHYADRTSNTEEVFAESAHSGKDSAPLVRSEAVAPVGEHGLKRPCSPAHNVVLPAAMARREVIEVVVDALCGRKGAGPSPTVRSTSAAVAVASFASACRRSSTGWRWARRRLNRSVIPSVVLWV